MIKIREGYSPDAPVLATVADRAEAREWGEANGFAPLSIQPKADEYRMARLYSHTAPL